MQRPVRHLNRLSLRLLMSRHAWLSLVLLNLLVAVTGYVKDVITAGYFGTGSIGDAYTTTYFLVDLVGILALGNAVGVASAVVFGRLAERSEEDFRRAVWRFLWLVLALSAAIAGLLAAVRWPLLEPFHARDSGFAMDKLYLLLLPSVLVYPMYYFLSGILQAAGRYAVSVGAPALLNVIVSVTGWRMMHDHVPLARGSEIVAVSVPVGACAITLLLVLYWSVTRPSSVRSAHTKAALSNLGWRSETGVFLGIAMSYAVYLLLTQGLGIIERYLVAARLPSGSLAAMSYAVRISQIPNWVFMSAVGTWLLPHMARAFGRGARDELGSMLGQGMRLGVLVCIPISIIFIVLRGPIVEILFQRHAFTAASTEQTAAFLAGYGAAIVFQALAAFLFRAITVTSSLWHAVPSAVAGVVVSAGAELSLIGTIGPMAVGVGEALGSLLMVILLAQRLARDAATVTPIRWKKGISVILSNFIVILLALLTNWLFLLHFVTSPWIQQVLFMAVCAAGIAAVYVTVHVVLWRSPVGHGGRG